MDDPEKTQVVIHTPVGMQLRAEMKKKQKILKLKNLGKYLAWVDHTLDYMNRWREIRMSG